MKRQQSVMVEFIDGNGYTEEFIEFYETKSWVVFL